MGEEPTNRTDPAQAPAPQICAVTISREYGSGGGEIAARLAQRLGWHLVDHEVVAQVARALGVSEAEAAVHDEHVDSLAARILSSLNVLASPVPAAFPDAFATDWDEYDVARRAAVQAACAHGRAVIVGRGGQVLLADRRDVLHARIVAPLEARVAYVQQREGLSPAAAQARVQAKDRDREHFLQAEHHASPADARLYDIVVNTGVLDLDSAVDVLLLALERKGRRLTARPEELGPGAGLGRYPETPGNFAGPPAGDE